MGIEPISSALQAACSPSARRAFGSRRRIRTLVLGVKARCPTARRSESWFPLMESNHDPRIQSPVSCRLDEAGAYPAEAEQAAIVAVESGARGLESNRRPSRYKGAALPLSYAGSWSGCRSVDGAVVHTDFLPLRSPARNIDLRPELASVANCIWGMARNVDLPRLHVGWAGGASSPGESRSSR